MAWNFGNNNDEHNESVFESLEEYDEEFGHLQTDDDAIENSQAKQLEHMLDSLTRIGGEVCKLRAEVDELHDHNQTLESSFQKIKDVLNEKGQLDLDDFQLACDVFEETHQESSIRSKFPGKLSH